MIASFLQESELLIIIMLCALCHVVCCAGSLAPSSALPIGIDRKVSETQLVKIEPGDTLPHSILAISAASAADEATVLETCILGFIYV
jgi:hypothetical protein